MNIGSISFSETVKKFSYRKDIDGIRAIAILMVIINHLNTKWLPGGYLGVDIFFVISGFVITGSLFNYGHGKGLPSLLYDFYAKRLRRITPALLTNIVICSTAVWIIDPQPQISLQTGFLALFGFSNFYLWKISQDYFSPSTKLNAFTHTWSLGVEEQIYLLYPCLLKITGFFNEKTSRLFPLTAICALSIVSAIVLMILPGHTTGGAAYLLPFGRFWEFGIGCIACLLSLHFENRDQKNIKSVICYLSFLCIIFSAILPQYQNVLWNFLAAPATAVLILFLPHTNKARLFLSGNVLQFLGKISYSLYLWHWPILSLLNLYMKSNTSYLYNFLLLTFFTSISSYFILEKRLKTFLQNKGNVFSYLLSLPLILFSSLYVFTLHKSHNPHPLAINGFRYLPDSYENFPVKHTNFFYCTVELPKRPLHSNTMEKCTIPPANKNLPTLWVMGDSHAGHLMGLLSQLQQKSGYGIHLVETVGEPFPASGGISSPERQKLWNAALARMKSGDFVVLGRIFLTRDGEIKPLPDIENWLQQVGKIASHLEAKNVSIIIMSPIPMFRFDSLYNCAPSQSNNTTCDIKRKDEAKPLNDIMHAMIDVQENHKNLYVFDAFSEICPEELTSCSPVRNGIPLYRDKDHLNVYGSEILYKNFSGFLKNISKP
ncbi:acyltransferase family protein [Acetobacter oryzoeni]|uniref:Acyltransferase n=1 Tax=Acetobacter oryzoeni TaxID=2500548 RepID=A0A5B9GMB0_9PROT|nr:acyltransferase family protein [Acetobacter oryzoeni]MCP1203922.1 acyltransferase [Acetobacter oryzoeni]QEE86927.1 acyltransferase [Acetobacter oryzoeni]